MVYTDLTLDEIAALTGFVDASHLSKHFTSKVGVTPIKFRKIYGKSKTKFNRTNKNIAFEIADYIHQNYAQEKLSAGEVASKFGISVAEMNRLMLYYSTMNFEALLNFVRINRACELLASTDYYVIDVAFEVGYNNIKTFNINFFKYKGMTPSDFRNRITLQKSDGSETGKTKKKPPASPKKRSKTCLLGLEMQQYAIFESIVHGHSSFSVIIYIERVHFLQWSIVDLAAREGRGGTP